MEFTKMPLRMPFLIPLTESTEESVMFWLSIPLEYMVCSTSSAFSSTTLTHLLPLVSYCLILLIKWTFLATLAGFGEPE